MRQQQRGADPAAFFRFLAEKPDEFIEIMNAASKNDPFRLTKYLARYNLSQDQCQTIITTVWKSRTAAAEAIQKNVRKV